MSYEEYKAKRKADKAATEERLRGNYTIITSPPLAVLQKYVDKNLNNLKKKK
jgi:hypothetical protein